MNCNDFKEKVADLFDKNINMETQAQLNEHMAYCPECKAYYDELRETFNMLQPQEVTNNKKAKAICSPRPPWPRTRESPSCKRASRACRTWAAFRWKFMLVLCRKIISLTSTLLYLL